MKTIFRFIPPATFVLLLSIYSCKPNKVTADNTRKAVDPAFAEKTPFRDFEVNADLNDTLKLSEGTNIFIPAGTFVDADGNSVKGKVHLLYRAFYSPGAIIASGITMRYDTNATTQLFSSAGMFELTGEQNGKEISIAPKKSIALDFASTHGDAEAKYSFYHLDTTSANWEFISTTKADSNSVYQKIRSEINSLVSPQPVEPKICDGKQPVIDMDMDLNDHPELSGYNGIVWQYAGEGNDPSKNEWIYSTDWTAAKLTSQDNDQGTYTMELSNGKKTFSTKVNPTFKGSDFTRALSQFKMKMENFLSMEKIRKEKLKALADIPIYRRAVAITRLGIHNCDAFYAFGNPRSINAEFHFTDPDFEYNKKDVTVYVISANGGISVAYNALGTQNVFYFTEQPNCLIAVLKGTKKAAILNSTGFSRDINMHDNGSLQVMLGNCSQEISNEDDLNKLLGTL